MCSTFIVKSPVGNGFVKPIKRTNPELGSHGAPLNSIAPIENVMKLI